MAKSRKTSVNKNKKLSDNKNKSNPVNQEYFIKWTPETNISGLQFAPDGNIRLFVDK